MNLRLSHLGLQFGTALLAMLSFTVSAMQADAIKEKSAEAGEKSTRASDSDYRRVTSIPGLGAEQLEAIDKAYDQMQARLKDKQPVGRARLQFYVDAKKVLSPQQIQELKKFHDPIKDTSNLEVQYDVPYVSNGDPQQVGDLFLPKNIKATVPAVLFIHGGGWSGGSKEQAAHTAIELAKHGYAVYNINYRLVGRGGDFPADVSDVKDAFAFLSSKASEWKIDPARIAAMGGSAGAHLSMLLGYTSKQQFPATHYPDSSAKPTAIVSWFGPADLNMKHVLVEKYLAKYGEKGAHDASPLTYADTAVPTLFVHGTADQLVAISHSEQMKKALEERKIPSELVPIAGAGHGFKGTQWNSAIKATTTFLDKQFKK